MRTRIKNVPVRVYSETKNDQTNADISIEPEERDLGIDEEILLWEPLSIYQQDL